METLLTVDELAFQLKLAKQTIRRYVLEKSIPFLKIRKAVRFRPSEIDRWVDSGGISAGIESKADLAEDLFSEPSGIETAASDTGSAEM